MEAMGLTGAMPAHVAMIMDGNGRWAKKRGLPRVMGHRAGVERLNGIVRLSSDVGIQALSLYAFSTENWKRPQEEVGALCSLLVEYFSKKIDELHKNGVCIRALGDMTPFPEAVRDATRHAMQKTAQNTGLKLNIALNYGGHDELLRAMRSIARDVQVHRIAPLAIDQRLLEARLDTAGLPPVDFLIRTGGEQRLSNFLLYQAAYAELLFLDTYWPDFTDDVYMQALKTFIHRDRRFGGL